MSVVGLKKELEELQPWLEKEVENKKQQLQEALKIK